MLMSNKVAIGMAVLMVASVCGCGGPKNEPVTSGSASGASPTVVSSPNGKAPKDVSGPPSSAAGIPPEGITIRTDPNDPKFKPAPGMMGGG